MPTKNRAEAPYRQFLPDESYPRFSKKFIARANTYEWLQDRLDADPLVGSWTAQWRERLDQPYKGITEEGTVRPGLYLLASPTEEPNPPAALCTMAEAATSFLALLSPEESKKTQHDIEAKEWRAWANPELYVMRHGLRLEETSDDAVDGVHSILKASLSPSGYSKAVGCMRTNHLLGEIIDARSILNERSYNFSIFGSPSLTEPWGWQLTGHHLCLNCFMLRSQQVISPVFMGAAPNTIDDGPYIGLTLFEPQEAAGRKVMTSLESSLRERVQIYKRLQPSDGDMPESRFHRADQRHLGGAFQDTRIIPYEGIPVIQFPVEVQQLVKDIARLALDYLPEHALAQKMTELERHWHETYFCWIGKWGSHDAFYYKLHSPVTMLEFDHHSGVFLTNKDAQPFHIHTLVRTPNGNDYGKELLRHYRQQNS